MTYEEALSYIHSICWKGSKLGLDRTRELLGKLNDPQKELKFILSRRRRSRLSHRGQYRIYPWRPWTPCR